MDCNVVWVAMWCELWCELQPGRGGAGGKGWGGPRTLLAAAPFSLFSAAVTFFVLSAASATSAACAAASAARRAPSSDANAAAAAAAARFSPATSAFAFASASFAAASATRLCCSRASRRACSRARSAAAASAAAAPTFAAGSTLATSGFAAIARAARRRRRRHHRTATARTAGNHFRRAATQAWISREPLLCWEPILVPSPSSPLAAPPAPRSSHAHGVATLHVAAPSATERSFSSSHVTRAASRSTSYTAALASHALASCEHRLRSLSSSARLRTSFAHVSRLFASAMLPALRVSSRSLSELANRPSHCARWRTSELLLERAAPCSPGPERRSRVTRHPATRPPTRGSMRRGSEINDRSRAASVSSMVFDEPCKMG